MCGAEQEKEDALKDIQNSINEYGESFDVIIRTEGDLVRDDYGGIKQKSPTTKFSIKAFPIIPSPTSDQLEHAGLKEKVDVVLYTAKKDWADNSYTFNDIDRERCTVKYQGETYEIKDKTKYSQFLNDYLYYNLGITKK